MALIECKRSVIGLLRPVLERNHFFISLVQFFVISWVNQILIVLVARALFRDLAAVSAFAKRGPLLVFEVFLDRW